MNFDVTGYESLISPPWAWNSLCSRKLLPKRGAYSKYIPSLRCVPP